MNTIKLYLDQDGVFSNFEKKYREIWHEYVYDRERFRAAVLEKEIFKHLELMPNAMNFLSCINDIIASNSNIVVEMLTSTGSSRSDIRAAAMQQKSEWLKSHGIDFKANFVSNKKEKSTYATPTSILVDDSDGCVTPFIERGGVGILHRDEDYYASIDKINLAIQELRN